MALPVLNWVPLILLISMITDTACAQDLSARVRSLMPGAIELYQDLHRQPELSLQESATADRLATELRSIGFEVTEKFAGHGIVAVLKNDTGPRILYRTDMDALPISEETGLEYASKKTAETDGAVKGIMHACGHDVHMSVWMNVARLMSSLRDQWKGTLILIGQPAEELGRGAQMMLDAGLYDAFGVPDFGIALHASAELPAGAVGLNAGFTMARAENVEIRVFGKGAHGAQPDKAVDPIVLASAIILDLQTIVSRNLKPTDAAVITVGSVQGGTTHNIIPDVVTLKLTVRTFTEEVRELVHQRINEIARGHAVAAGLPEDLMPEVMLSEFYAPANFNNPDLVKVLHQTAVRTLGSEQVRDVLPQMVAEDFARYGLTKENVPTVLFWLGTVPQFRVRSGEMPGLHTSTYYPDPEGSLYTGVLVTTQMLLDLFAGK